MDICRCKWDEDCHSSGVRRISKGDEEEGEEATMEECELTSYVVNVVPAL